MNTFQLTEITTKDKLMHQGIFFAPSKKTKKALLWVHGLTSTFYNNVRLLEAFTKECESRGFGFASFNTRGHDVVTGIRKLDKRKAKGYSHVNGGAGYEDFKTSVFDIAAGIDFLVSQGFSEVVVIGHSTGANKICYYAAIKKNPHLAAVVLASPVSDRYDPSLDHQQISQSVKKMEQLIKKRQGDTLMLNDLFFPMTPKRYVSLQKPFSLEDQFDYGEKKPKLTHFSKIKKPLLVILGANDEYLHCSVEEVMAVYDAYTHSSTYLSVILPDTLHSYNQKEQEVAETIAAWVQTL